jgi:YVTN family beta-propeller protein
LQLYLWGAGPQDSLFDGGQSVTVNPETNLIYVANHNKNTISVINGSTNAVIATISTKVQPDSMAINPNTNLIYVTSYFNDTVLGIDV